MVACGRTQMISWRETPPLDFAIAAKDERDSRRKKPVITRFKSPPETTSRNECLIGKLVLIYLLLTPITLASAIDDSRADQPSDPSERRDRLAHHAQSASEGNAEVPSATSSGLAINENSQTRDEFLKRQTNAQARSLSEILENLAVLSVGQKHDVSFECELGGAQNADENQGAQSKIVWLKLTDREGRQADPGEHSAPTVQLVNRTSQETDFETTLLSLNKRLITPDKRFRIDHRPPNRWILTLKNVGQSDDRSYYLCQSSGGEGDGGRPAKSGVSGTRFIGGAKLNVLVQPRIIESETSPSQIVVSEYESARLQCKVISEPQAQISWRREDGRQLDNLEQQFRHQIVRRPSQIVSLDSSELIFDSIRREQAGAYLCIASNGVLSGVSQRINVLVENCRPSRESAGQQLEPCRAEPESANSIVQPEPPTTTGASSQQSAASNQRPSVPSGGGKFAQTKQQRNWKTMTNGSKQTPDGNAPRRPAASADRRRNYADLHSERQRSGAARRPAEGQVEPAVANAAPGGAANCALIQMVSVVIYLAVCGRPNIVG